MKEVGIEIMKRIDLDVVENSAAKNSTVLKNLPTKSAAIAAQFAGTIYRQNYGYVFIPMRYVPA